MKKILFIMPLMAISLLASCNKKVSTLPIKCLTYASIEGETRLISEILYEYNNNKLLIKDTEQFTLYDYAEIHEYEYDDKGNTTKYIETTKEEGEVTDTDTINYEYSYDEKGRILKKIEYKDGESKENIDEYTYESSSMDWSTHKYSSGATLVNDVKRTFNQDGLYEKAVDSIKGEYSYYTWNKYRCNTKIEIYNGEEKTSINHLSDEIFEYYKNKPDKVKKYVLTYYEDGEIESNETFEIEYDKHGRKKKIFNYDEDVLNSYYEYKYAN